MRIVFVSDSWFSQRGGIQTVNRNLAIASSGAAEITCIVPAPSEAEVAAARSRGVVLLRGGEHYLESVKYLQNITPNVIVGHSYFTGPAAKALAEICDAVWIQFVHMDPEDNESWKEYRSNRVAARASRSTNELDLCQRAQGVVCIGPRLYREFRSRLTAADQALKPVLELNCGIENRVPRPLPDTLECCTSQ